MESNELRAMCEQIIASHSDVMIARCRDDISPQEYTRISRTDDVRLRMYGETMARALLSRLDAEDAMREHRIQLEPLGKSEWRAWCLHACEIRDDAVEAVLAVAACVAKIKEQTKESPNETA